MILHFPLVMYRKWDLYKCVCEFEDGVYFHIHTLTILYYWHLRRLRSSFAHVHSYINIYSLHVRKKIHNFWSEIFLVM